MTCSKNPVDVAACYENNGKGQFTKRIIGRKQGSCDTCDIDMDADGDLDVLIAGHTSNNVVWFENPLCKEKISHTSGGGLTTGSSRIPRLTYVLVKTFLVHAVFKAITLSLTVEILSDGRESHIFNFIQSLKK